MPGVDVVGDQARIHRIFRRSGNTVLDDAFCETAQTLLSVLPPGREASLAMTQLQQAYAGARDALDLTMTAIGE